MEEDGRDGLGRYYNVRLNEASISMCCYDQLEGIGRLDGGVV